jgi:hypothetical protein
LHTQINGPAYIVHKIKNNKRINIVTFTYNNQLEKKKRKIKHNFPQLKVVAGYAKSGQ